MQPQPRFHRTREPEARWVYERCYEMWTQRNWASGPDEPVKFGIPPRGAFTRGLQRFIYEKQPDGTYKFIMELDGGTFEVKKDGADYMWAGSFGLPKIPADDELVEIKLAI